MKKFTTADFFGEVWWLGMAKKNFVKFFIIIIYNQIFKLK